MTVEQILLLGIATLAGGFAFGVTGFAYGVVSSMILHHGLAPPDVVFIAVSGGTVLNLVMLPRFWREIDLRKAAPYLLGATFGMPLGIAILQRMHAPTLRLFTCAVVIAYCLFALLRHGGKPLAFSPAAGRAADTGIGFVGGIIGGVAGLGPLLPSVWYGLRGMSKTESRGLTQPFGLYVQGVMTAWFLMSPSIAPPPLGAIGMGIPVLLVGAWLGLRLFDRISVDAFRLTIVWLSLGGALALMVREAAALVR